MTLCGADFDQTPVSITTALFDCASIFFVGNATYVPVRGIFVLTPLRLHGEKLTMKTKIDDLSTASGTAGWEIIKWEGDDQIGIRKTTAVHRRGDQREACV